MNRPMLLGAVIGSPISHSLSPAMYRAAFASQGVVGDYDSIECEAAMVSTVLSSLVSRGARGVSVTMPLKEAVIEHLSGIDPVATVLGAVNCVVIEDGRLIGHNTDGDGCCDALHEQGGVTFEGEKAVVLGAGGTGRSVALALGGRGCDVIVVNRTESRTIELIDRIAPSVEAAGGTIRSGTRADLIEADVLVNTTSVGMGTARSPIEPGILRPEMVVLDAVYQPLETTLLSDARNAGARTIDGLWMLVHQARRQCVLQFGWNPEADVMREAAERELSAR